MIGILDWGIGGLSVLRQMEKRRPDLEFIYVADSGSTPYGKLPAAELRRRVLEIISRVPEADAWMIACNAASTVFLGETACRGLSLTNVIDPTLAYLRTGPHRRLGVIGGQRTVESHAYARGLGQDFRVEERSAQPLSAMIERGQIDGPELRAFLTQLLVGWDAQNISALVMACTHYPAVAAMIAEVLPGVDLIDPATCVPPLGTAPAVGMRPGTPGRFLTTGDAAATEEGARRAFGYRRQFLAL